MALFLLVRVFPLLLNMPPSDQCAVGTDGKLLDQTIWTVFPFVRLPIVQVAISKKEAV